MEWKNLLIGIFVAYIVIDILLAHNGNCPSILQKCSGCLSDNKKTMFLIVGILVGIAAWWLASMSTENYTLPAPTMEELDD
jgi:hypothetical protein